MFLVDEVVEIDYMVVGADLEKKIWVSSPTTNPIRVSLEKQFYLRHKILYNNIYACVFAQLDIYIGILTILKCT